MPVNRNGVQKHAVPRGKHHLDEIDHAIAIRPECLAKERTKLIVGHTKAESGGCWTARTSTGTIITTCSGKMLSSSTRRDFNNAAGTPLFTLRRSRFSISQTFWLEAPQGDRSVDIKVKWALLQAKLDVSLKNAASDAREEVKLEVRSSDPSSLVTTVTCEDKRVAIIRRKQDPSSTVHKFLPEYDVDVASGLDLALVSPHTRDKRIGG